MRIMNKKHISITIFGKAFVLFALLLGASCSNSLQKSADDKGPDIGSGETYLVVQSADFYTGLYPAQEAMQESKQEAARTLNQKNTNELVNLELKGTISGGTEKLLAQAATFEKLSAARIPILAGNWQLTLTGTIDDVTLTGTTAATIETGKLNSVSFTLSSQEQTGGLNIKMTFTGNADKVTVTLKNEDKTSVVHTQDFTSGAGDITAATTSSNNNKYYFSYIRSSKSADEKLAKGTYYLTFDFYHTGVSTTVPLNTSSSYIRIANGIDTKGELAVELNEVFSITYNDNGGELAAGESRPLYFSRKSNFTLPQMTKSNSVFLGWFESDSSGIVSEKIVETIPEGTTGNKLLTARYADNSFNQTVLYVSDTGNDITGNGTSANPFKTIGSALGVIIGLGQQNSEWEIKISGSVPKAVIPETITAQKAKSVTLTGANELDSDGIPVDKIDNGAKTGTVLTVNSSVPVTITNLKLTGGVAPFGYSNAGGIVIAQGSTVCLGDGAVVVGNANTSSGYGGAVHNEGTLYMYGSAVIGNKLAIKPAVGSSSTSFLYNDSTYATKYEDQLTANYSSSGGGVYNGNRDESSQISAKLYMGYKPDSDGNPARYELTGGFYANGAGEGGAIYNAPNSFVYFDSGIIKYSTASSNGGGIYNGKKGTVEMTGGQIIENIGYWPGYTSASGGGIYNVYDTARFIMSGGVINKNWTTNNGGAIANGGKVYIYGTAVIGNDSATSLATAENYGNKAVKGGAIYNNGQNYGGIDYNQRGELYIGYRPGDDGTTPVEAEYTGGIYQNFSTYETNDNNGGGGAICSTGKMKINGGTIAWNYANKNGGGIYSSYSNSTFFELSGGVIENNAAAGNGGAIYLVPSNVSQLTLSGSVLIPAGNDNSNDLYLTTSTKSHYSKITIGGPLSDAFAVRLTIPFYDSTLAILKLADGANTTIAAECGKFNVAPEVKVTTVDGQDVTQTTNWYISETGTLIQQQ